MKTFLDFIHFVIFVSSTSASLVTKDDLFSSPDGFLQASIDYHADHGANQVFLKIKNLRSNVEKECGPILTPVHAVLWNSDSATIVLVQHMANGSVGGVAHSTNGIWAFSTMYLPIDGPARYSVSKVSFVDGSVQFIYRVAATKLNGQITGYYVTGFNVDPTNFHTSKVWKKEIDLDTFISMGDLSTQ